MLRFCLVDVRSLTVYYANAPSKFFSEGKLGKPKEEIGNQNEFEYMYLSGLKVPYLLVLILHIHISYFHGHDMYMFLRHFTYTSFCLRWKSLGMVWMIGRASSLGRQDSHTILAAGSPTFVHTLLTKLSCHPVGVLLYATDAVFRGRRMCDILGQIH
jgi:hypothetical protein